MRVGILIRGLPGSGKTTLALKLKTLLTGPRTTVSVVENDLVRKVLNNDYQYDVSDYELVRSVTRGIVRGLLEQEHLVIVSNVFSTLDSISNISDQFDKFVIINCSYQGESVYGVSGASVESIRERWETHPSELPFTSKSPLAELVEIIQKILMERL